MGRFRIHAAWTLLCCYGACVSRLVVNSMMGSVVVWTCVLLFGGTLVTAEALSGKDRSASAYVPHALLACTRMIPLLHGRTAINLNNMLS